MNWVTTNIRLPENLYMQLKIKAARERKSVAAVIRDRLNEQSFNTDRQKHAEEMVAKMKAFGEKMAKKNKGINMSQELIKMRYEQ